MDDAEREKILDVLFMAGPQWGQRSPEDIVRALDIAGCAIVPKGQTLEALIGRYERKKREALEIHSPIGYNLAARASKMLNALHDIAFEVTGRSVTRDAEIPSRPEEPKPR